MTQEQLQFQKRMRQLEDSSWQESRFVFTDFLNEAEYRMCLLWVCLLVEWRLTVAMRTHHV